MSLLASILALPLARGGGGHSFGPGGGSSDGPVVLLYLLVTSALVGLVHSIRRRWHGHRPRPYQVAPPAAGGRGHHPKRSSMASWAAPRLTGPTLGFIAGGVLLLVAAVAVIPLTVSAREVAAFQGAPVCEDSRQADASNRSGHPFCVTEEWATVVGGRVHKGTSTLDLQIVDGPLAPGTEVSGDFWDAVEIHDVVTVRRWGGTVMEVDRGSLSSRPISAGPYLALALSIMAAGFSGLAGLLTIAFSRTVVRRRRRRYQACDLRQGSVRVRACPTIPSFLVLASCWLVPISVFTAAINESEFRTVAPGVTAIMLLAAVLLTLGLYCWLRRAAMVLDLGGITYERWGRERWRLPWQSVIGLGWTDSGAEIDYPVLKLLATATPAPRVTGAGRSRPVRRRLLSKLRPADQTAFSWYMGSFFHFTAANEPLRWTIAAHACGLKPGTMWRPPRTIPAPPVSAVGDAAAAG